MNLKRICEEYYPLVLGYLLTLTNGNRDLAEDLTQETFFRAIKNSSSFKGESKVTTWLCQIAKYTFWQHLDKNSRFKQIPLEDAMEWSSVDLVDEIYLRKEANEALYKSIESLDKVTKEVVLYRVKGEMSFKVIGELLGKTENWARVTFYESAGTVLPDSSITKKSESTRTVPADSWRN